MSTKKKHDAVLVAAIDFGTTFSGYAYSFKGTFEKDPTKIFIPQKWEYNTQLSQKSLTCVLFNEKKEFDSFGYPAERKYSRCGRKKEQHKWFFFKRLKMLLQDKEIDRNTEIQAQNGQQMRAMTVFGASIKYMMNHLMTTLEKRMGIRIENDTIHWVLTVPAISSDSAKQFMRESAQEAGIEGDQLTIALEPVAASLYCQLVNEQRVKEGSAPDDKNISQPGTKFMCIDLGERTADITVFERQDSGNLTTLHAAAGDKLVWTTVEFEFQQLIISLVGANVLKKFEQDNADGYLDMMLSVERAKREFESSSDDLFVTVPIRLAEYYKDETDDDLEDAIKDAPLSDHVEWVGDKIIVSGQKMTEIFNSCATKLVKHVKDVMKQKEVKGTEIFLMVGGFSESDFMQKAISDNFKGQKLIIPPDTGLAVVKGAVIFGHRPVSVTSRRAKYTYGINISPEDPEDHRVFEVTDQDRCQDPMFVASRPQSYLRRLTSGCRQS